MGSYKKSEVTKRRITVTAAKMFAEKGYTGTTVREICAASGVSQSRVNYHFKCKSELAAEILCTTLKEIDRQIQKAVRPEEMRSYTAFSALYIRLWLGAFLAQDKYVRFCADLTEEGVFSHPTFEVFETLFDRASDEQGLGLRPEEKRISGYIFVSALSELIKAKNKRVWAHSNEKFCDVFVELFLKLLYVPRDKAEVLLAESREQCRTMEPLPQRAENHACEEETVAL